MATAERQHAQPDRSRAAWRGLQRWRRTRPFWGGLLTALAGVEILATTRVSFGALAFQMGPMGFLSWLLPAILVTCGLLVWFSPHHRVLYAVIAAVTAVFSLIAVNLGGFFVGLLLGAVGSALSFAWVPGAHQAPSGGEPADGGTVRNGSADDQPAVDGSADDDPGRDKPTAGEGADLPGPGTAQEAPIANRRPWHDR